MTSDLRCDHKLHGRVLDSGLIEIKCRSVYCGFRPGVVVLHEFDPLSGECIDTRIFRDPNRKELTDV